MKRMSIAEWSIAAMLLSTGVTTACRDTPVPSAAPTIASTPTTTANATCATGDGVNDACACDADARLYCAGFYGADWESFARTNGYTTASWKYGLIDCLGKNPVAAACTTSLARRETLNAQMMSACGSYCRGTTPQPGAEPCVDHLKSIYGSLDLTCRAALDAHEAAKALQGRGPL